MHLLDTYAGNDLTRGPRLLDLVLWGLDACGLDSEIERERYMARESGWTDSW